jgi:hypothetical protein
MGPAGNAAHYYEGATPGGGVYGGEYDPRGANAGGFSYSADPYASGSSTYPPSAGSHPHHHQGPPTPASVSSAASSHTPLSHHSPPYYPPSSQQQPAATRLPVSSYPSSVGAGYGGQQVPSHHQPQREQHLPPPYQQQHVPPHQQQSPYQVPIAANKMSSYGGNGSNVSPPFGGPGERDRQRGMPAGGMGGGFERGGSLPLPPSSSIGYERGSLPYPPSGGGSYDTRPGVPPSTYGGGGASSRMPPNNSAAPYPNYVPSGVQHLSQGRSNPPSSSYGGPSSASSYGPQAGAGGGGRSDYYNRPPSSGGAGMDRYDHPSSYGAGGPASRSSYGPSSSGYPSSSSYEYPPSGSASSVGRERERERDPRDQRDPRDYYGGGGAADRRSGSMSDPYTSSNSGPPSISTSKLPYSTTSSTASPYDAAHVSYYDPLAPGPGESGGGFSSAYSSGPSQRSGSAGSLPPGLGGSSLLHDDDRGFEGDRGGVAGNSSFLSSLRSAPSNNPANSVLKNVLENNDSADYFNDQTFGGASLAFLGGSSDAIPPPAGSSNHPGEREGNESFFDSSSNNFY